MSGYNTYVTKERDLENKIHDLTRKVGAHEAKAEEKRKLLATKDKLQVVTDKMNELEPFKKKLTIFEVPEKEDDFRVYIGFGKYYVDKANIYLTINPRTQEFQIKQKNVLPPDSLMPFVDTKINFEYPVLAATLQCVKDEYPEHSSVLKQQAATGRFEV